MSRNPFWQCTCPLCSPEQYPASSCRCGRCTFCDYHAAAPLRPVELLEALRVPW